MEKEIELSLEGISFSYNSKNNEKKLIENFSLEVEKGSFTTLLGESGCGKTTLLRIISGFLEPTKGKVILEGKKINGVEPYRREIGIVFQDYALFPHLTVKGNIEYGLKIHGKGKLKYSKSDIDKMVLEVAETLGIQELLQRFPHELSGGQQQRVALARALVLKPKILLMDEPLSSLDAKLRERVREELKLIQQKLGITTIYVTHDQSEALSLSDKIGILHNGKLLQYDTPTQLYFKPTDEYTADFIGRANIIEHNKEKIVVRPEWFELAGEENNSFPFIQGNILSSSFLGEKTRFIIDSDYGKICADLPTLDSLSFSEGRKIILKIHHSWKL